jgi:hypothetical protein
MPSASLEADCSNRIIGIQCTRYTSIIRIEDLMSVRNGVCRAPRVEQTSGRHDTESMTAFKAARSAAAEKSIQKRTAFGWQPERLRGCSRAPTRHAQPPRVSKHGTPRLIRRQPSAVTILSKWYYRQICSVKTMLEVFFVHIVLSKCLFARNEREGTRENNYKRGKRPRRATLFINTRAQNLLKDLHSILLLSSLIFSCLASLIISS